jgi:transposase
MGDVRLVLTDEVWADMAEVLAQVKRKDGRPPEQSDRMFLEAVLYLARTGMPWQDLPGEFGHWDAVYNRFRWWEKRGVWRKLWEGVQHKPRQIFLSTGGELTRPCLIDISSTSNQGHTACRMRPSMCQSQDMQIRGVTPV